MELVIQLKDIVCSCFVVAAAYFSYRQGAQHGLEQGIDGTLKMIEDKGFIKVIELEDGEIHILRNEG